MIKIKVPATSANLGPGFDTLGIALSLYNKFTFEEIPIGLEIIGCEDKFNNEENLIYSSMIKTFKKIGYKYKGIRINMDTSIPVSRGLGSSAACIVAGVMAANKVADLPFSKEEVLNIATEIEGHPDNIAPALFGGIVVSIMEDKKVYHNEVKVAEGLKFIALVPDFTLSTKEARAVLPSSINYKDAIYNVGRVSLLLSAFANGRFDLIKYGVKDSLHQPYRGELINGFIEIFQKCEELNCLGAYLSGAGPTIMAIIDKDNTTFINDMRSYMYEINYNWDILELDLESCGASYE